MKKVIRLTESDLVRIVKRVISEQKITDIRKGEGSDPYEYGIEQGSCITFFTRKKGTQQWVKPDDDKQYAIWKYQYSGSGSKKDIDYNKICVSKK